MEAEIKYFILDSTAVRALQRQKQQQQQQHQKQQQKQQQNGKLN